LPFATPLLEYATPSSPIFLLLSHVVILLYFFLPCSYAGQKKRIKITFLTTTTRAYNDFKTNILIKRSSCLFTIALVRSRGCLQEYRTDTLYGTTVTSMQAGWPGTSRPLGILDQDIDWVSASAGSHAFWVLKGRTVKRETGKIICRGRKDKTAKCRMR